MGLWRYSLAALILCAAMLDALWWVPAHQQREREVREPAVSTEISRCPHGKPPPPPAVR